MNMKIEQRFIIEKGRMAFSNLAERVGISRRCASHSGARRSAPQWGSAPYDGFRFAQSCYPRNCNPALPALPLRLRLCLGKILFPKPHLFESHHAPAKFNKTPCWVFWNLAERVGFEPT